MRSETVDASGDVVNTTVGTNTITVQFSRKLGRENYGNEECGMFMQVDVNVDDDPSDVEAQVKANLAFAKTIVYEQLGVSTTLEGGIVRDVPQAAAPKAQSAGGGARKGGSKSAPRAGGSQPDKTALWQELGDAIQNVGDDGRIQGFYDNRAKKDAGEYSEKSPDFKHISSGAGLWLDKCPSWFTLVLEAA